MADDDKVLVLLRELMLAHAGETRALRASVEDFRTSVVSSLQEIGTALERTNALLDHLNAVHEGTSMRQATEMSFTHVKLNTLVNDVADIKGGIEARVARLEHGFQAMQHGMLDLAEPRKGLQTPALTASLGDRDRLNSIERRLADIERWTRGEQ